MKKLLYILLYTLLTLSATAGEKSRKAPVYLILDTKPRLDNNQIQITRSTVYTDSVHKSPTIIFRIRSAEKQISENFIHSDYIGEETGMSIRTIAIPLLSELKTIDLYQILKESDGKNFRNFCLKLRDKTIYIIDREDISSDSFKAIEVKYIRHLRY
ncbi:MAG: hypothetical protein ACRCX4_15770 [Bacteroidales bacterium]